MTETAGVLIILPPSETKSAPPTTGPVLDLDRLAFPTLNPMRERVIEALIETSRSPDALPRLRVRPGLIADVMANLDLRRTPTLPAWALFAGALYKGLDADNLSAAAVKRAQQSVVIASSLFGAVRPLDLIPAHRLSLHAHLVGLGRLEPLWRIVIPDVLTDAAAQAGPHGLVLDLRSPPYQAIGSPTDAVERTVTLRILPPPTRRNIGDVDAKRFRGEVAHHVLELAAPPTTPDDLTDALAQLWDVRLDPPGGGRPWTIRLRPAD
jgi:hypothetical protein